MNQCLAMFSDGLRDAVHISINGTNDLFDLVPHVAAREVVEFRAGRERWLGEFEGALFAAYQQRMAGICRSGRRPDGAAAPDIQLLASAEQEAQLGLVQAVRALRSVTTGELSALGPRIAMVIGEDAQHDFDNPFGPDYLFDAVGIASRLVYPVPYIWRALMRRVIEDVTPVLYKIYVAQNRFLADRNVLPDIKARLRSRSRHRPTNDREIVAAFRRLHAALTARGSAIPPVQVRTFHPVERPPRQAAAAASATPMREVAIDAEAGQQPRAPTVALDASAIQRSLTALVASAPAIAAPASSGGAGGDAFALPANDDLMPYGVTKDLMVGLWKLQRLDLPSAIVKAEARRVGATHASALVPSNLIPHIRTVLGQRIGKSENAVTADLVGMMFDYVFLDPAIPPAFHATLGRLQVPMLTVAMLDSTWFIDHEHPARRLLEDLAAAAIVGPDDSEYFAEFLSVANEAVRQVCAYPNLDGAAFADAGDLLQRFIVEDSQRLAMAIADDVAAAEAAERRELARSQARLLIRDRLAGVDLPQRIRAFAETTWTDYVASINRRGDPDGTQQAAALRTLEGLCSTILAKRRESDWTRVRAMIPALEAQLRRGCLAIDLPVERIDAFLAEFRELRIADEAAAPTAAAASAAALAPQEAASDGDGNRASDFVAEMIVGTWVDFGTGDKVRRMQLRFASPLRARYVFSGRGKTRAWVLTPEDVVHEFEAGKASIIREPVPLFERAIDAAFDALGGTKPRSFRYMTGRELETTASWTLQ